MYNDSYEANFSARVANEGTDSLFITRWSPRSFQKVVIEKHIQDAIFDAARFSPSAYNEQPWKIYTASRDTENFAQFVSLLVEANQVWAQNASLLGFMVAKKAFSHNQKENAWATYDCGFAWAAITFQSRMFGLYTHGMAGIKYDEVYSALDISKEEYKLIAGFAIGVLDKQESLPENFRKLEKPSARKSLQDIHYSK